ncbi:hypothetical protein J0H58_36785 [bacterium]|nr:hypothetical protein [bacterium]
MGVTDAEMAALAASDDWQGDAPDEVPLETRRSVAAEWQQQYADRLTGWGVTETPLDPLRPSMSPTPSRQPGSAAGAAGAFLNGPPTRRTGE